MTVYEFITELVLLPHWAFCLRLLAWPYAYVHFNTRYGSGYTKSS